MVISPVNRTAVDRAVVNSPQIRTGRVLRCVIVGCLFAWTGWGWGRGHGHGLAGAWLELGLGDVEGDDGDQDDAEHCLIIVEQLSEHCREEARVGAAGGEKGQYVDGQRLS